MMKQMKQLALLIVLGITLMGAVIFSGCSGESPSAQVDAVKNEEEHDEHQESEAIELEQGLMEEFDIQVATAGPGEILLHQDFPGEIQPDPDRVAHVIPRFPGVVTDLYKGIGDQVTKGEQLATIQSNQSLSPYNLTSLINGTVINKHMTLGETVREDHTAYTIADLSTVWAMIRIYQKDLPDVRVGQQAEITALPHGPQFTGRINYISPVVDEATRTAEARVIIPNPDGQWRPGMFLTAKVHTGTINADISIPTSALQLMDGQPAIFVETARGFEPRPITVGVENDSTVQVLTGLSSGQRFIARGAFTLKSELQKESFGGHSH